MHTIPIGSEEIDDNLLKTRGDDLSTESTDDGPNGLNWALELEAKEKENQSVLTFAKLVGQCFRKKLPDDKYKEKAVRYKTPSNCE